METKDRQEYENDLFGLDSIERDCIGYIISNKAAIHEVAQILRPDVFKSGKFGTIYEAIETLYLNNTSVEITTVYEQLIKMGKLEYIGGPFIISDMAKNYLYRGVGDIVVIARHIVEQYKTRQLLSIVDEVKNAIYEGVSFTDAAAKIDGRIMELQKDTAGINSLRKSVMELQEYIDDAKKGKNLGINITGIDELESIYDGAEKGDLIIVGGWTGSGKSSLFNTILHQCYLLKTPCYLWSCEMRNMMTTLRLAAAISGVDSRRIKHAKHVGTHEDSQVMAALSSIYDMDHLFRFEDKANDFMQIISAIRYEHKARGTRVFLLDRLEALGSMGLKTFGVKNVEEAKSIATTTLRMLANELGISIIVAAQFRKSSKDNKGGAPNIADIIGTGTTIFDATKVLLLHRPELDGLEFDENGNPMKNVGYVDVAKNTIGKTGKVKVRFNPELSLWQPDNNF
jgi:replicative DNA helicase